MKLAEIEHSTYFIKIVNVDEHTLVSTKTEIEIKIYFITHQLQLQLLYTFILIFLVICYNFEILNAETTISWKFSFPNCNVTFYQMLVNHFRLFAG